jgi:predicted transcriptional regulator
LILSFENKPTDLPALIKTLSVSASIIILFEFNITCGWLNWEGVIGFLEYEIKGIPFSVSKLKLGIFWYDVKYIEDKSFFTFSEIGSNPEDGVVLFWPFLIKVIGLPSSLLNRIL